MPKNDKILDTLTGRILKKADLIPAQLFAVGPDGSNFRYQPYHWGTEVPKATITCPEVHPQSQKQCLTPRQLHFDPTLHYAEIGPEQATYWRTDLVQAVPTEEGAVFEAELIGKVGVRQFMTTASKGRVVFVGSNGSFYWETQIKAGTVKILLP
jgi:hypothetical protein